MATQHTEAAFSDYLSGTESPPEISSTNILEIFPEVLQGGQATVQKARLRTNDNSEKLVALKVLKYRMEGDTENRQPLQIKSFAKEIRNAAKFSHENIVKIEGFFTNESDNKLVIVSTWANGGTMTQYTKTHSDCDLRNIAAGIARGLEYIHKNEIIHADLKGSNILMTDDGIPMLSDFGQARALRYTALAFVTTHKLREKGTLNWIAPEIADFIDGDDNPNEIVCTRQSDMWSYGMVIYELITGRAPYDDNLSTPQYILDAKLQRKIAKGELPVKPDVLDETKDWLWRELCMPCWKKTPGDRLSARGAVAKFKVEVQEHVAY